jgi:hypothetical protein
MGVGDCRSLSLPLGAHDQQAEVQALGLVDLPLEGALAEDLEGLQDLFRDCLAGDATGERDASDLSGNEGRHLVGRDASVHLDLRVEDRLRLGRADQVL